MRQFPCTLVLLFVFPIGHVKCDEPMSHSLKVQVLVGQAIDVSERQIVVIKDRRVFGPTVKSQRIRVDSKTRGLADVFVWISIPPLKHEKVDHSLVLENGNYGPHALIANAGDLLKCSSVDPVLDLPTCAFQEHNSIAMAKDKFIFVLDRITDRPERILSAVYPWMSSYVFVQEQTTCQITDQLGQCEFSIDGQTTNEHVEVHFWHSSVTEWKVESNFTLAVLEPKDEAKYIRLPKKVLADKEARITLTAIEVDD